MPKIRLPTANLIVLPGHHGAVRAVSISPERHKDPAANPIILRGHDWLVNAVAISPDNHWVITVSQDSTARLWDLSAKDPAASPIILRGHEGAVIAVAISPDSRWVVTGSLDNTARLWLLQMKDLVDVARMTLGRNFSNDEWQLYFPGQKYRKTFSDLPGPDSETPKNN